MEIWRIIRKPLIVIVSISVSAIILLILAWNFIPYIHEDLMSSTSPDAQHRIEIEFSSENAWPFGAHTIHIYQKSSDDVFRKKITTSKIWNDGGKPFYDNCSIEWLDSIAVVKLNGEEQSEEIITIDCVNNKLISNQ